MLKSLEDYIVDLENRSAIMESINNNNNKQSQQKIDNKNNLSTLNQNEDIWLQLQQKENDLVLAAELGNALLEKNQELKRQQEQIIEEYSKKLEAVEQDRHLLKRKLLNKESELDVRIIELQNDISELNNKLQQKDIQLKQYQNEKQLIINELNQQNQRLRDQLKNSQLLENSLQLKIEQLTEQCKLGKTNLYEHMTNVDGLKDELDLLNDKNKELERRLNLIINERDSLTNELDEASEKCLLLERHIKEQELRYQHTINEFNNSNIDHENNSNQKLEQIESNSSGNRSLLAEMDISEPTLSQECMSVYRQLRQLVQQLKTHNNDDDSGLHSDCSTISILADSTSNGDSNGDGGGQQQQQQQFSAGLLSEVAQELVTLVLDTDVVRLLERLEQARREIHERDLELTRRSEIIMELNSKVSVCEIELQAALDECERIKTDSTLNNLLNNEEDDELLIKKARDERDVAIKRKTKLEMDLAKTRVELMQANSQLLEAIQQKIELSQQLEQWQMDMQELLDEQLKNKLINSTRNSNKMLQQQQPPPTVPLRRRFLASLFQR